MESAHVQFHSCFTEFDISLFKTGKHYRLYDKMGAHPMSLNGVEGCYFAVYAPNAEKIFVVGDFNHWKHEGYMLYSRWDGSGIWEGFIPGVTHGMVYKYKIFPYNYGRIRLKADPYAVKMEVPPRSGSIVWSMDYSWNDSAWMQMRQQQHAHSSPVSVYELHFGSWKRNLSENRPLSYAEMKDVLVDYLVDMEFTHVEFLPLTEFPYDPSWGYQVSGYFAATSRYGNPEELMSLIDQLHQAGIGVIFDWVPAHFPADDFSLATFDGSCVYEHPDRRKGFHPDWNTLIFNYGRPEVRSFLISSAFFWMEKYHADGLRVDAVSSIVYLDYSRKEGEWEPNHLGGRENLDAISFVKECNTALYEAFPGIQLIAEEATSFPLVSRPVDHGGLGYGMKWMMGWMHDTLNYFKREPLYRKFHQNDLTFSIMYAFSENFMLALSHDEVVHGKSSLIGKMSGNEWTKFANLRTLFSYMYSHPGSKLLFMGSEIGSYGEWNFTWQLDWHLLEFAPHLGLKELVKDLNSLYKSIPALHIYNFSIEGFEWIDASDRENSILVYKRNGNSDHDAVAIICNLNVNPHQKYKVGRSKHEEWKLLFNSDHKKYWGSDYKIQSLVSTQDQSFQSWPLYLEVDIPPLSVTMYTIRPVDAEDKSDGSGSKSSLTKPNGHKS